MRTRKKYREITFEFDKKFSLEIFFEKTNWKKLINYFLGKRERMLIRRNFKFESELKLAIK